MRKLHKGEGRMMRQKSTMRKMTYTVWKIGIDGKSLSHKENLDNIDEVNEWLEARRYNNVLVLQHPTNNSRRLFRTEHGTYRRVQ